MRTSAQISFGLFDVTALPDCSPASPDKQPFIDMDDLKRDGPELPGKAATLEQDFFLLDGSFAAFPDSPSGMGWGYWSESMSGADGVFSDPPVLTISFGSPHSSIGLTLRFDLASGDYCRRIRAAWYDAAGTLLSVGEYDADSAVLFIDNPVEDYKQIVLTVLETSAPYRYAKITSIQYGSQMIFSGDSLISAKVLEEIDLTCSEIAINTLDFSLHSEDADFSPLNPKGAFAMLQQRQKLIVTEKVDGESVPMGTFYLDTWKSRSEKEVDLSAIDIAGVIDQTDFMGGVYTDVAAGTLLAEILGSAGAEYELDESLEDIPISGYLPVCTHRQALQQAAFAIGAVVDCSRSERIRIYPPPSRPSGYITRSRKFLGGTVEQLALVTGVDVTAHRYLQGGTIRTLCEDEFDPGQYTLTFDRPVYSVSASGASVLESSANYAMIQVNATGTVTVTGEEYTETTRVLSERMADLSSSDAPNIAKVEQATLTGSAAAKAAAKRLYDYYQNRFRIQFQMTPGTETVGDHVVVDSLNRERLRGIIESMEVDLTGGFLSTVTITGKRIETVSGSYTGEIYTGEWGMI